MRLGALPTQACYRLGATAPTPASPNASGPPGQGLGPSRTASFGSFHTFLSVCAPKRDALLRSLQPTRCHEYPPVFRFPSVVLAHFRSRLHQPPSHTRACACRTRRVMLRRRVSVAGNSDPKWSCGWAPQSPAAIMIALSCRGSPPRSGGERPGRVFSTAHEPDEHVADVLCRTTVRLAGATRTVAPRTHSSRGAPTPRGCEPRTPFLDESPNAHGLATVCPEPPLLPQLRRRSAASNTRSRTRCVR